MDTKNTCPKTKDICNRSDYATKIFSKRELNPNIHLSEGNIKSKCTDEVIFLTWSLPSRITCPYSTQECRKRCFAKKNETFGYMFLKGNCL